MQDLSHQFITLKKSQFSTLTKSTERYKQLLLVHDRLQRTNEQLNQQLFTYKHKLHNHESQASQVGLKSSPINPAHTVLCPDILEAKHFVGVQGLGGSSTSPSGSGLVSAAGNFGSLQQSSPNPRKQFSESNSDSPPNSPMGTGSNMKMQGNYVSASFKGPIPRMKASDIDGDGFRRTSDLFEGTYCLDEVAKKSFASIETYLKKGTSHFQLVQIMKDEYSKLSKHMDRVEFFYYLLATLIEYGVHVTKCIDHTPQCPPKANCHLLTRISQPVLKPFISWVNNRKQLVVEVELLEALEKFIYEKGQYRVATVDIMDVLFRCGVSAGAFGQWSSSLDTCDGIKKRLLLNQIINQGFLLVRKPK